MLDHEARRQGFTLIELLVVIVIISIIISILLVNPNDAVVTHVRLARHDPSNLARTHPRLTPRPYVNFRSCARRFDVVANRQY